MNTEHTKVIIIEGPDNCGKDTLIKRLSDYYSNNVKVLHACKPTSDNLFAFYRDGIVHDTLDAYYNNNLKAVIHNRSMYGEYVYGNKYRNKSKSYLAKLIYSLEIGQLRTFITDHDLYFILLTCSDADLLVCNDDGNSISNKKSDIEDEIDSFNEIYRLSSIKNKCNVKVNIGSEFRSKEDIFNDVINFIELVNAWTRLNDAVSIFPKELEIDEDDNDHFELTQNKSFNYYIYYIGVNNEQSIRISFT